jgi:Cu(I)/Ag(I) efflux system periplasmic protein CusF
MKSLNPFVLAAVLAVASTAGIVHAQTSAAAAPAASAPVEYTDAEVRKVDKENKKITLKHGEIKNLSMPPMSMVFDIKDAASLDKVKPGDKVRFKAVNEGGQLTVVELQPAK